MKTITLQDRHALLLHALLKRLEFSKALAVVNAPIFKKYGHCTDGTDICIKQYPADHKEVDAAICAACDQLKYQLHG